MIAVPVESFVIVVLMFGMSFQARRMVMVVSSE